VPANTPLTAALTALEAAQEAMAAAKAVLEVVVEEPAGSRSQAPVGLLLKFDDAARVAGVSRTAVYRAVRDGRLPAVECPDVGRRIRRADLEAFVAALSPKPNQPTRTLRTGQTFQTTASERAAS
jgi:excisionase family DNA binding protein